MLSSITTQCEIVYVQLCCERFSMSMAACCPLELLTMCAGTKWMIGKWNALLWCCSYQVIFLAWWTPGTLFLSLLLFYPRDAMLARVIVIATCPSVRLSVRLSVRPSVTRRYCVKTKKTSGMISSPSGSLKTLVFRRQISSPNSKGFPPNGGLKQGSVGKIQRFFSFKRLYLENGSRYGQSYY